MQDVLFQLEDYIHYVSKDYIPYEVGNLLVDKDSGWEGLLIRIDRQRFWNDTVYTLIDAAHLFYEVEIMGTWALKEHFNSSKQDTVFYK